MKGFRNAINVCGFQDMGYERPNFTWCNRRSKGERIRLRLDRVLATVDWMELYHNSKVYHIVDSTSNHCEQINKPRLTMERDNSILKQPCNLQMG